MRRPALIASVLLSGLLLTGSPIAESQPAPSAPAPSSVMPPGAASGPTSGLNAKMQQAVLQLAKKIESYGGSVGVHVVDVATGETLALHAAGQAFNPASNMKVVTAAAALWKLGPNHAYHTALYAKPNGVQVGDVVLRSYGDPSLAAKDLWELAGGLVRWGVRRVKGDVLVDQSYFDARYVPPGFEQQPNEWAYFRAPVSAVALEANTVTLNVAPRRSGERAWVTSSPDGFVDVRGRIGTGRAASAQNVTLRLITMGDRLEAQVGGSIPEDSTCLRITKRVDDPTLYAGYVLRSILVQRGIEVAGKVRAGGEGVRSRLTLHSSAPLGTLLHRLGKDSDNFYAEMIFKGLDGGKKRRGLTSKSGGDVVRSYLKEIGADDEGNVVENGSGLFDTNRLTPRSLTTVLRASYRDEKLRPEFVAHLAIGGEDGTLRWRFRDEKSRGRVRAKTGTMASVTSLSGYVMRSGDDAPVAFSIMVNGVAGKVPGARAAIDRCVEAVVREVVR